ncbi:MAG: hypothetical protein JNG84_05560 [Archangium sp.]|nr:hypothetical protein [Archangium sp.]
MAVDGTTGAGECTVTPLRFTFAPAQGPVGGVITLEGTELDRATSVVIAGTPALLLHRGPTHLRALVMPGTQSGVVEVMTSAGPATSTTEFTRTTVEAGQLQLEPTLNPSDLAGPGEFGSSLSLDAEGKTIVVGALRDASGFLGASWVFARADAGGFTQQGPKLADPTRAATARCQGIATAIDALGETLVVGGPCTTGATWTYQRQPNGTWAQQGPVLAALNRDGAFEANTLALSADGHTLLVGVYDSGDAGVTAMVFERAPDGGWTPPGARLTADARGARSASTALDFTGTVAIVAASYESTGESTAWIFARGASGWRLEGGPLRGDDARPLPTYRASVALSGDGRVAFLTGVRALDGGATGAVWRFTRTAEDGGWRQHGPRLDVTPQVSFGYARQPLAVSAEGDRVLLAGMNVARTSAALVQYRTTGSDWTLVGAPLFYGNGGIGASGHVPFVAMSLDGHTAALSAVANDGSRGGVRVIGR